MPRKKVKLAWVENDQSREISLKKRSIGLMKKVKELTILCDVNACMIVFSPDEVEPMVWPSLETAYDLLDDFFALPEIEKKKKETSLDSYLKEKTKKNHDQLMKTHKKNMGYVIDQLMVQLKHGRRTVDLNLSEIYALLSFSRDNIIHCRKKLDFVQYPPLRDPPMSLSDVFVEVDYEDERAWKTDEVAKRFSINAAVRGNQSHYLTDNFFLTSPEPPKPTTYSQIMMDMVSNNQNSNLRNYFSYQGSCSTESPNLEMEPVWPPLMTFHDVVGSTSQPVHDHIMINNPSIAKIPPRRYPFDSMSCEFKVKEEVITINNGDSDFYRRSNTTTINDGIRQEAPPNETTSEEGNVDVMAFHTNNYHF